MLTGTNQLFPNNCYVTPKTQGIKYAGSKLKLLPYIVSLVDGLDINVIFDGFSGTTRVSQAFAQMGFRVVSSDISEWSRIFGTCYLLNREPPSRYREMIDHLNAIPARDGWFTENYGGYENGGNAVQSDGFKRPWQIHNTRKLDAIREEIDLIASSEVEKAVVLTALILAMDEVDSTLGHFASYLRTWSPRSYKKMTLKTPKLFENVQDHSVIQADIFDTLETVSADLAYFDPPYGSNNEKMPPSRVRYASYYHLWTSIIKNDAPPLFGGSRRRKDSSDTVASSVFEDFRRQSDGRFIATESVDRLIGKVRAEYVALSYSSGGRATAEDLNEVLRGHGTVLRVMEIDYKRNVMANMSWTGEWLNDACGPNREFIFLIRKKV